MDRAMRRGTYAAPRHYDHSISMQLLASLHHVHVKGECIKNRSRDCGAWPLSTPRAVLDYVLRGLAEESAP